MNLEGLTFVIVVTIIILTIGAIYVDIYLGLLYQYVCLDLFRPKLAFGYWHLFLESLIFFL